LAPGSIVAMDRGYNDCKLFAQWIEDGIYFVTRLKVKTFVGTIENALYIQIWTAMTPFYF